jgi:DHA1 family bicyclomycin/chloramphenicol resistance-like MFS transporter
VAGVHHWAALLLPACGIFMGHGIVFPCAQAGSVAPFPRLAGAAAGMFGFLLMVVASGIGTLIGATHDGTVRPLVFTMTGCGIATFAAARLGVGRLPADPA